MRLVIILTILFAELAIKAYAQQTVFNVPSADVTPEGHLFLQHESQFRPYNPHSFWLGTHYTAVGIGHNTELDATLFNVSTPRSNNITLGLGFKSAMPVAGLKEKFPEREIKLTVGSEVLVSLEGEGVGNWSYAHLSGRLPKLNTRVTAGISAGTKQVFGKNTVDFIAAVEQPVTKKLCIIGDWYSGHDNFTGFLIVGVSYKLPKDSAVYAGFQFPNSTSNGHSGFVIEVSKILPLKH